MKLARFCAGLLIAFVSPSLFAADPDPNLNPNPNPDPQVIEIRLGSYYIKPEKVTVKVGQPVTLKIINEATMVPHDLIIAAPEVGIDVRVDVPAGKTGGANFTPGKVGVYEMFCDKKLLFMASHKEKGMKGVLEVIE
jgi:plastocyanin